ncbi:MAG TPA: pyrroline-5-carboxylate reductase [Thermoleophilaceae bacterium]|jgi:pyrroline-5-carboxylate reductase|nr:pyrroline-5-carboxylate reductase [Thermoleophilaceae bacterium]
MKLGFIGAGNMASALARGIGEPIVVCDIVAGKAEALVEAVGGEVVETPAQVAEQADAVVLAHKPGQLAEVAAETNGAASVVVSILGGVPTATVEEAYPNAAVHRFLPNIPVELGQGVLAYAPGSRADGGDELLELFGRAGRIVRLPKEELIEPAMALMSCGPAFMALVAEALVDAGVLHGLGPDDATAMVIETMAGSAAVLRETGGDTRGLRRRVTSPGGSTARGLAALEQAGLRAAFEDAVTSVVEFTKR